MRIANAAAVAFVLACTSGVARAGESDVPADPFCALERSFRQQTSADLPHDLKGHVFKTWLLCETKNIAHTSDAAPKNAIVFYHTPYGGRGGRLALSNGDGTVRLGGKETAEIDAIPGRLGWVAAPKPVLEVPQSAQDGLEHGPRCGKPGTTAPGSTAPVATYTPTDPKPGTTTDPVATTPTKPEEPAKPTQPTQPTQPGTYTNPNPNNPNKPGTPANPDDGAAGSDAVGTPPRSPQQQQQQPNYPTNYAPQQGGNNGGGNNGGGNNGGNNGGGNNGGFPQNGFPQNNNGGSNPFGGSPSNSGQSGGNNSTPAGPAAGYSPSGDQGTQAGGRTSSKGFIMLPASGEGFMTYTADKGRWGKPNFVYGIERASRAYITDKYNGGASKVNVGDISLENGGPFSGHASHQKGVDADFALPRLDGKNSPRVDRFSSDYSRISTQNQMNFIRKEVPVTMIFFNDPGVAGRQNWPNHDNHFHVRISEQGK